MRCRLEGTEEGEVYGRIDLSTVHISEFLVTSYQSFLQVKKRG